MNEGEDYAMSDTTDQPDEHAATTDALETIQDITVVEKDTTDSETVEETTARESQEPEAVVAETDDEDEAVADAPEPDRVDIFWWANAVDGVKDQLDVELFIFSKNYAVYSAQFSKELNNQLKPLFLQEMVNYVTMGAAMGLAVRDFEESAGGEENVLQRTLIAKVQHAQEVWEQMSFGNEVEIFSEEEHEFKRMKGIVAKFSHTSLPFPFFIAKLLPVSQVLHKGPTSWGYVDGNFKPFDLDAGLKVTPDNQVLLVGPDIFVFNEPKFTRLFGYDVKLQSIADKKIKQIEDNYRLVYPEGQDINTMIRGKKATINKLQKCDNIGEIKQDQLMDHAEEMELDLMTDDTGAIIIMESRDMDTFVGLLNDDYVRSEMTNLRYIAKGKKRLDGEDDAKA
jgi:hypothetical protein